MANMLAGADVLVTGGTGFIGSHLTEKLLEYGANPIVVDNNSRGDPAYLADSNGVDIIVGDLTNRSVAEECAARAEFCFHLAAIVGDVDFMTGNPHRIYENLIIDYNVFKACRTQDVRKVLYTSSACVYPIDLQKKDYALLSEEDAYRNGANPDGDYGWTKVVGEQMAVSFSENFELPIAIVRPFNPYGPRESFDPDDSHVIPAFIRRAADGVNPFVVWGSGEQVRTFTYVRDLVEGMVVAMSELDGGDVINLSDTKSVRISELAETVLDVTGHDVDIVFDESKPEGVKIRKPSIDKADIDMNWETRTSLSDGIRATYEWYVEKQS